MKILKLCGVLVLCISISSCAFLDSKINDIKGSLIGNAYTVSTYDNYGNKVLTTQGDKINIRGNSIKTYNYDSDGNASVSYELSSVITIDIDGREMESCGDTCIFVQDNLNPAVEFDTENVTSSSSNLIADSTFMSKYINKYRNLFGKSRVVVIKSQLGQPIVAYSGDDVYWEIPKDLPKMTKLMIDGKALYIHRANFQIIDTDLLN